MRRVIFTITAIAAMMMPLSAATISSPVKMQKTLLSLYRQSDAIFVARFDKKEYGEIVRSDSDYSVASVETSFDISQTLKGETRKFVALTDEEYQYSLKSEDSNEIPQRAVFIEDFESFDPLAQPQPGDAVLLFMKKEDGKLILTDYRDGIKKLMPEEIAVYIDRINELNSIFSAKQIDNAAIVGWLVRCAENPATRWEGTFELLNSFQRLAWQRKKTASGETVNSKTDAASIYETASYARALNEYQKTALTNILLMRQYQQQQPVRGDSELINLVKYWKNLKK